MEKHLFFLLTILFLSNVNAQNRNISVTLSYPQPLADGTFNSYTGIGDIGLQFQAFKKKKLELGIDLSVAYFAQKINFLNPTFTQKKNVFLLQPKVYASINNFEWQKPIPFIAIGYSAAIYSTGFNVVNGPPDENEVKGGLNLNAGLKVGISKQLFVKGQFDYVEFVSRDGGLNLNISNNFTIIKLGLGYTF